MANGPVPSPSRRIAICGWASSDSRSGRGAMRLISITRSVIATDVLDRAELVLEAVLASRPRSARLSSRATCSAVILRPSGQLADGKPEDVAEPVVADRPALGEAADDIARGIEADQALRDIGEEHLVRARRAGPRAGSRSVGSPPITSDLERAFRLLAACRRRQCQRGEQQQCERGDASARFTRKRPFSKPLDISLALYYLS